VQITVTLDAPHRESAVETLRRIADEIADGGEVGVVLPQKRGPGWRYRVTAVSNHDRMSAS
jgi:hypothetical protein